MAGRSQDKKGESSSRSKKSALPDPENPQSSRQGSQPSRTSQSKPSKNTSKKEKFPETSSSTSSEVAVESKTSAARGQTDLLWIITDQPSDFKNPDIRQKISRHVMRDYLKDQGSKESKSQRRKNPSHSSHSDEDLVVSGSTSHLPLMPSVERSGVCYFPLTFCISSLTSTAIYEYHTYYLIIGPQGQPNSSTVSRDVLSLECGSRFI